MEYNHALFLFPYIEGSATSTMKLFPPLGLEYVAASAKDLVKKITLLDLRYEPELSDKNKLLEFIRREIDIVCVNITWDRQFDDICDLLNKMPEEIPVIVGGYKATERAQEILERCPAVTMVARGEGEETIREIFQNHPPEEIEGISFRKKGRIQHNNFRGFPDVDTIAAPDRALRRNKYYLILNGVRTTGVEFDSVLSARGCPFNCKFCTFNLNPLGQKRPYAARSITSVVDEIEELTASVILLADDEFFADKKRAEKFCDEIIARKIKKRFIAQSRIDVAKHPQLLKKMVQAGFKALLVGIESPHDWILKQMNKGFNSQTIRDAFKVLKKYPIYYHGYFIYGNIGETEQEMLAIPRFAKEIGVDGITFNKLRIEKFSSLRGLAENTPGYHITDTGALYSDKYSHAALKKIGRRMRFSFYTPWRFIKMLKRVFLDVRFFSARELISFAFSIPLMAIAALKREKQKGRLGDSLKRIFIKNK